MQSNQLPNGSKILLIQGPDGLCYQTGYAKQPNGRTCQCAKIPGWQPAQPNRYNPGRYALLSPQAYNQMVGEMAQGASALGNTYGANDLPNQGPVGVSRREGNASPMEGDLTFSLILNNTAGATIARQFIGDISGTYVLLGNTELTPAGFVIGGSWGTNSKTQFAQRTAWRPWRVKNVQFIASVATYFNTANLYYFDTKPTPNGPVKDSLTLTNLLSAAQYNPTIQWFDKSVRFDGVNGLDIEIPAGQSVNLQFNIVSEGSAGDQVLLR